jgi:uncharacterized membrane protein
VSIGPVQLIVLGFNKPDFKGEVIEELGRLRDNDVVRVIDSLTVYKDAEGNVASLELSQMDQADRQELGAKVGALIGFGAAGEEGAEIGAAMGAEAAAEDDDGMLDDALDVLAEIPPDSAAAIILLEHRWAIPLRDAVYKANGFPVASTFVTPIDLVAIGLLKAEEARMDQSMLERADSAKSEGGAAAPAEPASA